MSIITVAEPSQEVWMEDLRRHSEAKTMLLGLKVDCQSVYGAWLPGESDTDIFVKGDYRRAHVIIYLNTAGEPVTAMLAGGRVILVPGWGKGPGTVPDATD